MLGEQQRLVVVGLVGALTAEAAYIEASGALFDGLNAAGRTDLASRLESAQTELRRVLVAVNEYALGGSADPLGEPADAGMEG